MSEPQAPYSASGESATPEAFTPSPIRFRVWDGERMHGPGLTASYDVDSEGEVVDHGASARDLHERTFVAMLSTGLRDADGREVFEGDRVALKGECYLVWCDAGCHSFRSNGGHFDGSLVRNFHPSDIRVVGNVYQGTAEPARG